jgi:hypothetical protein
MAAPAAISVDLAHLAQGEDFGVVFSDGDADWSAADAVLILTPPSGTAPPDLAGTVSVDGTEATFTALGSTTASWVKGRWTYEFWIDNGGGSRDLLVAGQFTVFVPVGGLP